MTAALILTGCCIALGTLMFSLGFLAAAFFTTRRTK